MPRAWPPFYAPIPNAFTDPDVEIAAQFGVQAAVVLANAQAYWDAQQLSQTEGSDADVE